MGDWQCWHGFDGGSLRRNELVVDQRPGVGVYFHRLDRERLLEKRECFEVARVVGDQGRLDVAVFGGQDSGNRAGFDEWRVV